MKLNDPFGRMARRHQTGYESMRAVLQNAGIETPEAARAIIRKTRVRAVKFLAVCLVLFLLSAWLLPNGLVVSLFFAILVAVWVVTWMINGKRYIDRYIEEDLNNPD
jgi:hypothetical protein